MNYTITELISPQILTNIQDSYSRITGLAVMTVDDVGSPAIKNNHHCDYCIKTRSKPLGRNKCDECNRKGVTLSLLRGESVSYTCHAGLTCFAAPIVADGQMIGGLISGQFLTAEPNLADVIRLASDMGLDPSMYIEMAKKIPISSETNSSAAMLTLSSIANILSNIADQKYQLIMGSAEVQKAAKMKSDFLANMSHEIRTPMNAVIGMAEMALREDLNLNARNYITQIKSSGQALLSIINDILDFSKIESGKMDIIPAKYEPLSMINDLANMFETRIGGKNVELVFDVVPDLPRALIGDMGRIKQIFVNITNNAIKFTNEGQVKLSVSFTRNSDNLILMRASIIDTGIGIKKEDFDKIFDSFQQVDSKRNRNIEGTGLGLAITKQLLSLMDGSIEISSEYGKGSTFTVSIPQTIENPEPSISSNDWTNIIAGISVTNPYVKKQLITDLSRFKVKYMEITDENFNDFLNSPRERFIFVESSLFTPAFQDLLKENPELTCVLMVGYNARQKYDIPNLVIAKKPTYCLSLANIFNRQEVDSDLIDQGNSDFHFTAPDGCVLLVDDNPVNLTVAEGLLRPLNMRVDTALSGKEAIEKISIQKYDIVFMDHMMPEIDGVETTRIIRRFHPEYSETPIIALTANAIEGTKEMFLQEGMNDFVAKPIDVNILVAMVRKYLPIEKIVKANGSVIHEEKEAEPVINIKGLDTKAALKLLGSEDLYWSVLKDYYNCIEKKAELIKQYEASEDWKNYTIEVHALKSASRQIGALELGSKAEKLEMAGKTADSALIHSETDSLLARYKSYIEVLKEFFPEEETEAEETKEPATKEQMNKFFEEMKTAIDDLDSDKMEEVINEMKQYSYNDWQKPLFDELATAVEDIDSEKCEEIISKWIEHED